MSNTPDRPDLIGLSHESLLKVHREWEAKQEKFRRAMRKENRFDLSAVGSIKVRLPTDFDVRAGLRNGVEILVDGVERTKEIFDDIIPYDVESGHDIVAEIFRWVLRRTPEASHTISETYVPGPELSQWEVEIYRGD